MHLPPPEDSNTQVPPGTSQPGLVGFWIAWNDLSAWAHQAGHDAWHETWQTGIAASRI